MLLNEVKKKDLLKINPQPLILQENIYRWKN
jgi:hypothetical protein